MSLIYMEIQKIFSNVEDPQEVLYSVLMSEEEVYLFSETQKKVEETRNQKALRRGIVASAAVPVGITTGYYSGLPIGAAVAGSKNRLAGMGIGGLVGAAAGGTAAGLIASKAIKKRNKRANAEAADKKKNNKKK